jgi:transposase
VLHREIAEQGYGGGIRIVQRFLKSIRPKPEPEPIVRFETAPGKQLQIDFVVLRRGPSPLRTFTVELGYSRYPFVDFTDNERADTLIASLERAIDLMVSRCTCGDNHLVGGPVTIGRPSPACPDPMG